MSEPCAPARLRSRDGRGAYALLAALVLATGCARPATPGPAPSDVKTNKRLYDEARVLLEQGRYVKAREILTEIGLREPIEASFDPFVKLAIADSYYYEPGVENIIEAQSRYAQFVSFFPTHELSGYAQFQIGMCNFKQSPSAYLDQAYTHRAIEEFDKVRTIDPAGRFAQAAEQMKQQCRSKLARHDYEVALFYFKKKAWMGSISRFKKLIETHPQFEESDAVYYHLGVALIRWGSLAEGKVYLEKMIRDYPESDYVGKARAEILDLPEEKTG